MRREGLGIIQKSLVAAMAALLFTVGAATSAELDHPWTDGFYSTISGVFVKPSALPKQCSEMKLKVPGFKKDLPIKASLRNGPADLVVILNGTFSRSDNPYATLWTAWLEQDGRHVLTFDSPMCKGFVQASRHGVPGNLEVEARKVGDVIQAFLQQPAIQGKVRRVGVVGISYGGVLALHLGKLAKDGALPFELSTVQAYSPPVSVAESSKLLDGYYSFKWTKVDLYTTFASLPREFPVKGAFNREMMECALGRAFREDLKDAVEFFDGFFDAELKAAGKRRLLTSGNELASREERMVQAEAVSFREFYAGLTVPYWQAKDRAWTAERLLAAGELRGLLKQTDGRVQVVLSANDPLNADGSAEAFAHEMDDGRVQLLSRGGHLGYFDSNWTRSSLARMFDAKQPSSTKASSERDVLAQAK